MPRLILIILSLCCCGFDVDTPEGSRKREEEYQRSVLKWQKMVKKHYDLKALHKFLIDQIKAHPTVEDIDLSKAKVGNRWKFAGMSLISGNWSIHPRLVELEHFTIYWIYETVPSKDGGGIWRTINFECRKTNKSTFELIAATRSDDEYIELIP